MVVLCVCVVCIVTTFFFSKCKLIFIYVLVLQSDENELITRHVDQWNEFWTEFEITVGGDPELVINLITLWSSKLLVTGTEGKSIFCMQFRQRIINGVKKICKKLPTNDTANIIKRCDFL